MDGCAVPTGMDLIEVMNRAHISRLLSDNYTMLIVFVFITAALGWVLTYFVKELKKTIYDYRRYTLKSEVPKSDQDEVYTDNNDELQVSDPSKYQEANKIKFFNDVDQVYKDYNVEKTTYIKSGFNKENDDYIDGRMSYKKYDDYVYKKA